MSNGYELGGRYSADPIGSETSRGKDCSKRLSSKDGPHWTPTEQHQKNQLMRQFLKRDGSQGASEAYVNSPVWCRGCDGRRLAVTDGLCGVCSDREWAKRTTEALDHQLQPYTGGL